VAVNDVFVCKNPSCRYKKTRLFLRFTGEPLHDQHIDTSEQAREYDSQIHAKCPRCGSFGFEGIEK